MLRALSRWKRSILVVSAVLAGGLFLSRHLVGPLSSGQEPAKSTPEEPIPAESAPAMSVSPEGAARHVGKRLEVCGQVAEVTYAPEIGGQPTFINLGGEHPEQPFTAVIWGEDQGRWPQSPWDGLLKDRYGEEKICVTGKAQLHEGTPQIVVSAPQQIQVR